MVPSVSGAELLCSESSQTEVFWQNFSPNIVTANFEPVYAASASGRATLDDMADQPAEKGGDRQAKTKAKQMVSSSAAQKIAAAAPIDLSQMAEFAIYVEVPSLGTTRRLNSGAFHGKLNDLYERGLIARESVGAAMRLADDRSRQLR